MKEAPEPTRRVWNSRRLVSPRRATNRSVSGVKCMWEEYEREMSAVKRKRQEASRCKRRLRGAVRRGGFAT
jgi:hypothetical protein